MKKLNTPKIICPKCGCQYLPGEIYLPNQFLGQPKIIERDIYGKIMDDYGGTMDLNETYTCDKCNAIFSIRAKVQFETKIKYQDEPYKLKLGKKLTLSEV